MVAREQPGCLFEEKDHGQGWESAPFFFFLFGVPRMHSNYRHDMTIYHDSGCSICSSAPLDHSDHCSPGRDWLYLDVCSVLSKIQYTDFL